MKPKEKKPYFLIGIGIIALCLSILYGILKGWINNIKSDNLKDKQMLDQALPDFNENSITNLKKEIKGMKDNFWDLAIIFDPKDRWFKKDYDLSIYFVEELGRVNQFLKAKASQKQVNFPELGFKEKLPSEAEAFYLLSQLYGLKELLSLGMDNNINFTAIEPQGIEDQAGFPGVKIAKSHLEFTGSAQSLVEFIIQLNEIITRPQIEALLLKYHDAVFSADLKISHIIIDEDWKSKQAFPSSADIKEVFPQEQQELARTLRNNNPFFVLAQDNPAVSADSQQEAGTKTEEPSKLSRFLYKGKAVMKSKDVVVIEDTLNEETVFLGQGEKIDGFVLKEFSNDAILLMNADDGQEMIISRQEE